MASMKADGSTAFRAKGSIYGGALGVSHLNSDPTEAGVLNSDLLFVPDVTTHRSHE